MKFESLKGKRYIFYIILIILIIIDIFSYFFFISLVNKEPNTYANEKYEIIQNFNLYFNRLAINYNNSADLLKSQESMFDKFFTSNNVYYYAICDSSMNILKKSDNFELNNRIQYFLKMLILTNNSSRYYYDNKDVYLFTNNYYNNGEIYCIFAFDTQNKYFYRTVYFFIIYKLILFLFTVLIGIDVVKSLEQPLRLISQIASKLGIKMNSDNPDDIVKVFKDSVEEIVKVNREQKELTNNLEYKIKSMEKELLAKESLIQLSSITDGIAHQINNNLASMKGLLQIGIKDNNTEILKQVENEIDKLILFTKKFLEFSRDINIYFENIEISKLLKDLLNRFNIDYHIELLKKDITVRSDAVLLEQVFFNIFDNIEKYTIKKTAHINIQDIPGFIKIEIIDSGPGFNEEILNNPYKPFSASAEGYGLGIATIMKIMTLLNHKIIIENNNSKGKITIFFEKNE